VWAGRRKIGKEITKNKNDGLCGTKGGSELRPAVSITVAK